MANKQADPVEPNNTSTPRFQIGSLSVYDPTTGTTSPNPKASLPIYSDEEIYIGRDERTCKYTLHNPMVSNRHLKIYTIIFDRENPQLVAPLVYAQDLSMNGTLWNGFPMGKGGGSFLLSGGDVLGVAPGCALRFAGVDDGNGECFDVVQREEMKLFQDRYVVTPRKLGSGAYGQVHMAVDRKNGKQLACKMIDLRVLKKRIEKIAEMKQKSSSKFFENGDARPSLKIDKGGIAKLVAVRQRTNEVDRDVQEKLKVYDREARILETLCHPNIIGVEKVIKSSNTIYLFQDLITAGDLFSFIEYKGGRLGCIEAAVIIRQILMALDYLHDRNIVHRDLKPDNILMTSLADGCRVVLTDFGCARLVRPSIERMSTVVGTFEYSAPEVLKASRGGSYTKAVDLWSLGCVTVVLLTGGSPFMDPTTGTYSEELAHECDLERLEADPIWKKTRKHAKNFVRRLLVLDESKRMNVKQALRHCWFTNPLYKRELEDLYKRSVRDWKPRVRKGPLIVELSDISGDKQMDQCSSPSFDTASDMLDMSADNSELGVFHDNCSPTLSDPELPELSRERMMLRSHSSRGSSSKAPSSQCFQFDSDKWSRGGTNSSIQTNKHRDNSSTTGVSEKQPQQHSDTRSRETETHLDESSNEPMMFSSGSRKRQKIGSDPDSFLGCESDNDFQDEVYEEVNNSITGKRQCIIYGASVLANGYGKGVADVGSNWR